MMRLRMITVLAVCGTVGWAAPSGADAVVDWNAIASRTIVTGTGPARPGQVAFLDFAMVQAAVHDAVQAIERRYEPYHVEIPGASGSRVAATAKAAHDVLVALFPAQTALLDTDYQAYLLAHGIAADDPGVAVGQAAAAGILALRANDGRPACLGCPSTEVGGTDPGVWRPTPPTFATVRRVVDGRRDALHLRQRRQVPGRWAAASGQLAVREGLQRGQGARRPSSEAPARPEQTDIAHFYADAHPHPVEPRAARPRHRARAIDR